MIFMTQKTAKGDNKIYEEMDKHFQGTGISHRPPANIFHMRHGSAVSSYQIFPMI